jgi:tRNA dimethylallyltransferase
MSSLFQDEKEPLPYEIISIALIPSKRGELHQRIARRFESMLDQGLVEEVSALRERYALKSSMPSMRCVGYRQAWKYLEGEYDAGSLLEKAVAATRQFAKRQLTWLRAMPDIEVFDCLNEAYMDKVADYLENRLLNRGPAS